MKVFYMNGVYKICASCSLQNERSNELNHRLTNRHLAAN